MPRSSEALDVRKAGPLGLEAEELESVFGRRHPAWDAIARTPCLPSPKLSAQAGCRLFLKYENLQYTASFKERGALAKLLSLSEDALSRGVIAASAGNHAQGLSRHAALLGAPATIVMPAHTPSVKIEATRRFGAEIVLYGDGFDEAQEEAQRRAADSGMTVVHPFDDPHVCAGQGTVAAEMLEQSPMIDTLVVPIGGGGLIAGMASLAAMRRPDVRVIGVQSALWPGMKNALGGELPCGGSTLAEGIAVGRPGALTRTIVGALVDEIVTVDEAALERALCLLLTEQKTLVEGAGAAGLAAVLSHPDMFAGANVGLVLCGGNIDTRLLSAILMRDLARRRRLARLRIALIDVPGQLARVSTAIGRAGGNVIDVSYHKIFNDLPAKHTHLDISVEAQDGDHMDDIISTLTAEGLSVETANY